jgi:hypothetical protein
MVNLCQLGSIIPDRLCKDTELAHKELTQNTQLVVELLELGNASKSHDKQVEQLRMLLCEFESMQECNPDWQIRRLMPTFVED